MRVGPELEIEKIYGVLRLRPFDFGFFIRYTFRASKV